MSSSSLFDPAGTSFSPEHPFNPSSVKRNITVPRIITKPIAQLLDQLLPVPSKPASAPLGASSGNSFIDALRQTQNQRRTDNNAEAYASTTSAVLDAYGSLNENSSGRDYHIQLAKSWEESPDLTLRLIWDLRSITEGQNNKIGFYRAFGWLYQHHPRTAIENLRYITGRLCERKIEHKPKRVDDFEIIDTWDEPTEKTLMVSHGCYKDLLNIVVLALNDELANPLLIEFPSLNVPRCTRGQKEWCLIRQTKRKQNEELGEEAAKIHREAESQRVALARAQKATESRAQKRKDNFALLRKKLLHDKKFLALYATVAQLFADALAKDVAILKRIETSSEAEAFDLELQLSNAPKWAPTLDSFHDRATNMATAIALILHARGHMSDLPLSLKSEMTQQQAHTLRGYYRRWIISPLRRFIDIPEVKMSAGQWSKIDYERMSDICLAKNKELFIRHDATRFTKFLEDVKEGKCKIRHETLLPHQLLIDALRSSRIPHASRNPTSNQAVQRATQVRTNELSQEVVGAQWSSLVEQMQTAGTLENSLAIVDVSGSMGSILRPPERDYSRVSPIFPAVALGILLSTLTKPPFNNMFITFSSKPELLTIPSKSLAEQARWMNTTDWEMNTDYEAVFLKLLLPPLIQKKVNREDVVKRLFVFSDMQFDESLNAEASTQWETSHDRVVKAFNAAGYEAPEIVYWNLRGSRHTTKPVLQNTPGTALVTGFAANTLKLFMKGKVGDPMSVMKTALTKPCYAPLVVYD